MIIYAGVAYQRACSWEACSVGYYWRQNVFAVCLPRKKKSFPSPSFICCWTCYPSASLYKAPCLEPRLISQCLDSFLTLPSRGSCLSKCQARPVFCEPEVCWKNGWETPVEDIHQSSLVVMNNVTQLLLLSMYHLPVWRKERRSGCVTFAWLGDRSAGAARSCQSPWKSVSHTLTWIEHKVYSQAAVNATASNLQTVVVTKHNLAFGEALFVFVSPHFNFSHSKRLYQTVIPSRHSRCSRSVVVHLQ